jgi:hypothetical protein
MLNSPIRRYHLSGQQGRTQLEIKVIYQTLPWRGSRGSPTLSENAREIKKCVLFWYFEITSQSAFVQSTILCFGKLTGNLIHLHDFSNHESNFFSISTAILSSRSLNNCEGSGLEPLAGKEAMDGAGSADLVTE